MPGRWSMRVLPSVIVVALAVPLAGCFSVTAPKEIPGWAMSSQAEPEQPRARTARRATPRNTEHAYSTEMPTNTGNVAMSMGAAPPARPRRVIATEQGPTAFSAEWHAREDAADEKLRR